MLSDAPRQRRNLTGFLPVLLCLMGLPILMSPDRSHADTHRQFRAGAAKSNITPPLGLSIAGGMHDWKGNKIHDELWVRCLVLDDGENRLAVALCDSCMIPREILDQAKSVAQERTGLPPDCMMFASTHSHSAPTAAKVFQSSPDPWYLEFLTQRIADTVQRAVQNLALAKIGWGSVDEPSQVFNRRWKMKPGTIPPDPFGNTSDRVKMNPPRASEDLIEPAGPIDPEISVVSVQTPDGRPVAVLANYSLHYVGGTGETVSADYFGFFADRIQELLGADRLDPEFVGILSNGTSGNINNINFREEGTSQPAFEQIRHVANIVAERAHEAIQQVEYRDWVPLSAEQTKIELGVRRPESGEVALAREVMAKAKHPYMDTLEEIYALETVALSEYPEKVPVILQAFRIGDLAITAVPCEVFAEIGLELKSKSPFGDTFTIELANGYNGYLPTPEQHRLGGYETWRAKSSYLEVGASPQVVDTLMGLLAKLQ